MLLVLLLNINLGCIMKRYVYMEFASKGFLSYALLIKQYSGNYMFYLLDPLEGSKEFDIEILGDIHFGEEYITALLNKYVNKWMDVTSLDELIDLTNNFYLMKLSNGDIAFIHQVYVKDELIPDSLEPTGTFLVHLYSNTSLESIEVVKDESSGLYVMVGNKKKIDSLLLDDIGQYISKNFD